MQEILYRHGDQITSDRPLVAFVGNPEGGGLVSGAGWLFNPGCVDGMDYKGEIALADSTGEERNYVLSLTRTGGDTICVMLIISDVTMLTRAREAAEAASKAKGDFLSNMSHEMRTPMNAIIGMTAIAKTSDALERKDYCLGKIEDASTHLLGVINDILDMSKIEAKKFELSAVPFAFERVLQKSANVINFRMDEKHQVFTVRIDNRIPRMLVGDDQRLLQVLTNLLSNAVKFTPENGSIRMEAKLVSEEDGICTVQMEVTDTGIGISEEQKGRLFASFQQADSGTSRRFGGTGLGLAISKNIVEMMDGTIWVESELGKGSTFAFTVRLPRAAEDHQSLMEHGVNWDNLHVLMVDDAPEIREYFHEISKQIGFSCDTAESGHEALEMIEKNGDYDVYFVDWRMPEMDGIELSRRIKEGSGGDSVVIMTSATEWAVIEDSAREVGVEKFLPKPLFPSAITDCLNECLGAEGQRRMEEVTDEEVEDDFEGYRVLLAEDVEINREIVLELLEPTHVVIDCAENGAEALRMFEEEPEKYDMIFMDVQMPEMDGYEATRRIRQSEHAQGGEIPIVAMTANVFREDIDKCLDCGMNDHVGKPLDMDDVRRKIRQYLPKKG
jgi:signal transduction histidine kinase/DNA-binding response OmpR family regulator